MHLKLHFIRRPNQEERIGSFASAVSYRVAIPVIKMVKYPTGGNCYPLCPRCKMSMEREYVNYCDRCGQKLNWDNIDDAIILTAPIIR